MTRPRGMTTARIVYARWRTDTYVIPRIEPDGYRGQQRRLPAREVGEAVVLALMVAALFAAFSVFGF